MKACEFCEHSVDECNQQSVKIQKIFSQNLIAAKNRVIEESTHKHSRAFFSLPRGGAGATLPGFNKCLYRHKIQYRPTFDSSPQLPFLQKTNNPINFSWPHNRGKESLRFASMPEAAEHVLGQGKWAAQDHPEHKGSKSL